jgi:DNA-binding response OmpR family regulator
MKGKLFLVILNAVEGEQTRQELIRAGWDVDVETDDHGAAYDFIIRERPDVLVIDLNHQPAAARKVARSIRMEKGYENLSIVFVSGTLDERELAKAEIKGALFASQQELPRVLDQFAQ